MTANQGEHSLQLHGCEVDLLTRQVYRDGGTAKLTNREAEVLRYLADRAGEIVTREELERQVWGLAATVQTMTVSVCVRRLRSKIEPDSKTAVSLHTVWGEGWRLDLPSDRQKPIVPVEHNLRRTVGSFIGRAAVLGQVRGELRPGVLLTVTGPPGVGKTRLAREVALSFVAEGDFRSVFWCDASPLKQVRQLSEALAISVGSVRDDAELFDALRSRGTVLVALDNLEHLDAATWVAELAQQVPAACLLVTSRAPLGIGDEQVVCLGPLDSAESAALFLDRARLIRADLHDDDDSELTHLIGALDGLPLAIELAAGRTHVMGVRALSERADRPLDLLKRPGARDRRESGLAGCIEASWDLLDERERRVWSQLSVFPSTFDLSAARSVLAPEPELIETLESLTLQSLLQREGSEALRLLVTLRAFAQCQLDPAIRDTLERSHQTWTLEEARAARPHQADLIAALSRAVHRDDAIATAQLVTALDHWLATSVPPQIRGQRFDLVDREVLPADVRAAFDVRRASFLVVQGDLVPALELLETLWQAGFDDEVLRGRAALTIASIHTVQQRFSESALWARRAITSGEPLDRVKAELCLAAEMRHLGDIEQCLAMLDAVDVQIAQRDPHVALQLPLQRAYVLLHLGRYSLAERAIRQTLAQVLETPLCRLDARLLVSLSEALRGQGKYAGAVEALIQAEELSQATGQGDGQAILRNNLGDALLALGQHEQAEWALRDAAEMAGGAVACAARGNLGVLRLDQHRLEEAAALLEDATTTAPDKGMAIFFGAHWAIALLLVGSIDAAILRVKEAKERVGTGSSDTLKRLVYLAETAVAVFRGDLEQNSLDEAIDQARHTAPVAARVLGPG